ncbi:MAG: M23 family metallopeptidase [Chloroflexi bacterium]|nr:M23 family metallopeptidase [Chloroflexota bacterium]
MDARSGLLVAVVAGAFALVGMADRSRPAPTPDAGRSLESPAADLHVDDSLAVFDFGLTQPAALQPDSSDRGSGHTAAGHGGLPVPIHPFEHVVQPGETLSTIAESFGIDVDTLIGANNLGNPDVIPIGSKLIVLPVLGVVHVVTVGDTVNRVAERYSVTAREIVLANGLEDSELIQPGQKLIVPGARPPRVEGALATAVRAEPARHGGLWPAGGRITTYFGEVGPTSPRGHAGLDIAAPSGAPVVATDSGVVVIATPSGGAYGSMVMIDHGGGVRSVYGHLSRIDVRAGERVDPGEQIGLVGSTGYSTGPHLHFEMRVGGVLRDPLSFLP